MIKINNSFIPEIWKLLEANAEEPRSDKFMYGYYSVCYRVNSVECSSSLEKKHNKKHEKTVCAKSQVKHQIFIDPITKTQLLKITKHYVIG